MSTKQKLTPWFPGSVKPVRRGLYERKNSLYGTKMGYWNGHEWRDSCLCCISFNQEREWRGVAK